MSEANNTIDDDKSERFTNAINQEGFSFQEAVIEAGRIAFDATPRRSIWTFEAREFPVQVNGFSTRIDMILWMHTSGWWMCCECKRVNPKYNEWLFVETTTVRRNNEEEFVIDAVYEEKDELKAEAAIINFVPRAPWAHTSYQIPIPPEKSKGDRGVQPAKEIKVKDAIEDAATQILKGTNGIVEAIAQNPLMVGSGKRKFLVPVIFTTAKLFHGTIDPTKIELETGTIQKGDMKYKEVPYLYYQYHVSPGIKHKVGGTDYYAEPSYIMRSQFIRTVAVVTATGIAEFLNKFDASEFKVIKPFGL